jgi:hypothetical protein
VPNGIPAVEPAEDGDGEAAGPSSPGLERMRSTPSRPEE